jgi:glycosyltransferase involved in cell wall biosynthesis
MKIVYIVPGFGGTFYCGNCLRDRAFSNALKALGHDSVTLPLYLPHSIEEFAHQTDVPVFYGAVNIYLKQNFKLFRKMPKWLYNFFNSPAILRFASKKSSSTRATGLEEMTISMLKGEEGFQKEELEQLIYFLKHHEKPDVVHLSNALLMGLAAKIKSELNVPVFCTLQDEDVWINAMSENYKPILWKLMSERAKDIDKFISVSQYFADVMTRNMNIENGKIKVVHLGVDPEVYLPHSFSVDPPVIAYLSRLNDENGLGILVDAFIQLKKDLKFKSAKLKLTGGKTKDDEKYIQKLKKKLNENNLLHDVEWIEDFRTSTLSDFFKNVTVLSVPVLQGEAFGLDLLEALACGIPIVQPALAAFPEIVEKSGAGVVYSPNTPEALAGKLSNVLLDQNVLKQMSKNGRKAVEDNFNIRYSLEKFTEVYKEVLNARNEN